MNKSDKLYMDLAIRVSKESSCVRKKVGTVIVDKCGVILIGYNGTAAGEDNTCELPDGSTAPEVLHSEMNAFSKALRVGMSTVDATLYVTLLPCLECAKMVVQAGVSRVVYLEDYHCKRGHKYLNKCGVTLQKFKRMVLEDDDYAYER
jgi:dCMP deaminase